MPAASLSPHKFLKVRYRPAQRGRLGIDVDADRAIDIYTVIESDYEKWRTGRDFLGSTFKRRRQLHIEFNAGPEFEDDWYLIMENFGDDPADVEYDVFER